MMTIKNNKNLIILLSVLIYMLPLYVCMAQQEENAPIYNSTLSDELTDLQNKTLGKNSVYFELFGNGIIYSLGYERILWTENIFVFSSMSGLSLYIQELFFSQQINLLIGKKNYFELGVGCTLPIIEPLQEGSNISDIFYMFFYRIGYRYQKEDGGILFRAGFTPFMGKDIYPPGNWPIMPWGGITVGLIF